MVVVSAKCATATAVKKFEKCTPLPSQDASIAWTFHAHNATLDVAFFGSFISPSGWVGWGINPTSAEMTGTRALIAFPDPNSGQLVLLPYIIDPTVKLQRNPLLSRPLDVHLLSSSAAMYGGRMATVHDGATIQIYASVKLVPNKTKIHFVWNRGVYVQGYSPTIHPTTINDLASVSTIDVLSGTSAEFHGGDFATLKIVHGILNAISWGIMLPVGVVTARYLRHAQSLGPTWFYAHAGIQLSNIVLGTIGFGIGLRLGEHSPGRVYGLHRKLGLATFCLGILQTMALLFRPKTTNKFRRYWKSYHHFVGYACVVLGVVNVFQGFEVMGEGRSYGKLAYCLCLSTLAGVCVALEVNSWVIFCRKAKEEQLRREGLMGVSDKFSGGSSTH
nr:cytochrome B561 and DOMON domain-containing protein At2g04850 [Ipomoea batatas]